MNEGSKQDDSDSSSETELLNSEITELQSELQAVCEKIKEAKKEKGKYKGVDLNKFQWADFEYVKLTREKQKITRMINYRKGKKVSIKKKIHQIGSVEERVKLIASLKENVKDINKEMITLRKELERDTDNTELDNRLCLLATERSRLYNKVSYHKNKLKG